ncbi:type I restriction enzyme HsdR N-terminal domain-containing protein [Candidatus Pollutiaquabacter sp.]|uniref:type I restriction enzyme HsdR N-terminal domain-containing protein n=1 Tax=Candidatus Pollutiaquabacter sp. TaxID=3416354 RepID=UPI003C9E60F8|nr:type I restriction enzyme HsdR N-terminal domain-containing protein [Bacteroidota bacterium]
MLTKSKKTKLLNELKSYYKKYLKSQPEELDESGTRIMINTFLTDVLGFTAIEEVKTEYMIRGTYADYVIQTKGNRHFLVEVKSLSISLSDKHLRQAINYGANEGIEWALLTNGKQFDFYRIIFEKPIDKRLIFSFDLCDPKNYKKLVDTIQFLHKEAVIKKGLDKLWLKTSALDPKNVAGLLYTKPVINFLRRTLNKRSKSKFSEIEIEESIDRIVFDRIDLNDVKQFKLRRVKVKSKSPSKTPPTSIVVTQTNSSN